jgi:hypothetical protein
LFSGKRINITSYVYLRELDQPLSNTFLKLHYIDNETIVRKRKSTYIIKTTKGKKRMNSGDYVYYSDYNINCKTLMFQFTE